jgi:hypothetical protein
MGLFSKLARCTAAPSVAGPSSQESATDLATSSDVATERRLTEPSLDEQQQLATQTAQHVPDRSGHCYDRVHTEGQSRIHFGDVYASNVIHN